MQHHHLDRCIRSQTHTTNGAMAGEAGERSGEATGRADVAPIARWPKINVPSPGNDDISVPEVTNGTRPCIQT
jgi:hypothetical protein